MHSTSLPGLVHRGQKTELNHTFLRSEHDLQMLVKNSRVSPLKIVEPKILILRRLLFRQNCARRQTNSSVMAETPRELGDFKAVRQIEAKF